MSDGTGNNKSEWHLTPVESARVLSGWVFLFSQEKDHASVEINILVSNGQNPENPVPTSRYRDDFWDPITACVVKNQNSPLDHLSTVNRISKSDIFCIHPYLLW
ncbi:MAG: hypothetical protein SVM80_02640 [Halobacteriota archaeon]|nr:hypothetical protein [Halobacteriota archaeon]